ncbi:MAG TPA: hypothetical protein VGP07_19620 [Polyangia bacterium]|jgi:hypothetical protein
MGRSARFNLAGLIVGATLFGQLACAGNTQSFDASNDGQTTTVSPGDEIDIKLTFIGGSTYTGPDVSSAAVAYEGSSVVGPLDPGGPTMLFKFKAVNPGTAVISIPRTSLTGYVATFTLGVLVE